MRELIRYGYSIVLPDVTEVRKHVIAYLPTDLVNIISGYTGTMEEQVRQIDKEAMDDLLQCRKVQESSVSEQEWLKSTKCTMGMLVFHLCCKKNNTIESVHFEVRYSEQMFVDILRIFLVRINTR